MPAPKRKPTAAVSQKPASSEAGKRDKSKAKAPHAHKRTPANERILTAMVKAAPECKHALLAEALGVSESTLQRHYADLIPHGGVGRPEHVPTAQSRLMVEQHKALGLKHVEIAALLDISRDALETHYRPELTVALARTKGLVGSQIVARALSKTDKDAQRAAEFFMERMGGWHSKSRLGVGYDPSAGAEPDEGAPLVAGVTRADARKVALLLASARPVQVTANEKVESAGEAGNGRG